MQKQYSYEIICIYILNYLKNFILPQPLIDMPPIFKPIIPQ